VEILHDTTWIFDLEPPLLKNGSREPVHPHLPLERSSTISVPRKRGDAPKMGGG